jgi:hypothetical protein
MKVLNEIVPLKINILIFHHSMCEAKSQASINPSKLVVEFPRSLITPLTHLISDLLFPLWPEKAFVLRM